MTLINCVEHSTALNVYCIVIHLQASLQSDAVVQLKQHQHKAHEVISNALPRFCTLYNVPLPSIYQIPNVEMEHSNLFKDS